ncbi:MAG: YIP1 family protein [Thermoanaerobaculaceae bacterium]
MANGQPPETSAPPLPPLPWEDPTFPPLEGLYETVKLVLFQPREAFSRISFSVSLAKPLLLAVILGWVGALAAQLYNWVFQWTLASVLPGIFSRRDIFATKAFGLFAVVAAPVWILIGLGIVTVILHLFLLLYGGAGKGLEATFRTLAYSHAAQLWQIIPLVGGLVGLVWWLAIVIPGLATVHRTTTGKAAAAVLTPILLGCVCLVALLAVAGLGIFAALRNFS